MSFSFFFRYGISRVAFMLLLVFPISASSALAWAQAPGNGGSATTLFSNFGPGDTYQGSTGTAWAVGDGGNGSNAVSFVNPSTTAVELREFRFAANWFSGINTLNVGFWGGSTDLNSATLLESFTFSANAFRVPQIFTAVSSVRPLLLPGQTYFITLSVPGAPTTIWGWQWNDQGQNGFLARFGTDPWFAETVVTPVFDVSGPEECTTNVTRESQADPRWATNLYDHSSIVTIGEKGCALTSLSMALNNAGISTDPGSLNTLMIADGAYDSLSVAWEKATSDASNGAIQFHSKRINSASDLLGAKQYLDTTICQQHHPVIVGVNLDATGSPGHFVLVTGKKNNDYTIADPLFAKTTLSQYNNEFETRGFVSDPPGDLSQVEVAIGDVAEILVTDPLGRETGFDSNLQQIVEQIPTSSYFKDSLQDDLTGAPATETDHLTEIFQPTQGTYQIAAKGLKFGTYTLSVSIFSQDGSPQPAILIPGIAGPGSNSTSSVQLTSNPGSNSTVTVTATFSSTLEDIANSLQLGLIDNDGVADSLSQKIKDAQGATGNVRNNILNAFIKEVNAQTAKHITGIAVQVLLADAKALSAQ
jgi:hypothetical protein